MPSAETVKATATGAAEGAAGAERSGRSRTGASLAPACAGATHATSDVETRRARIGPTAPIQQEDRSANCDAAPARRSASVTVGDASQSAVTGDTAVTDTGVTLANGAPRTEA